MIENGKVVKVHYTGKFTDGEIFDSSLERDPLEFEVGSGMIIPGFEEAIIGKTIGDKVFISVKDNGNGIPDSINEKIFQPFFTTKPTGQGTGLGLSLSYDIVKAHGGELKVETKEGKGSTFTIQLPL